MQKTPPYYLIEDRDLDDINEKCKKSNKFMLSRITARPFERLQFLRGSQNLFLDIGYNRPEFYKLLEIIHEYYIADIKSWTKTAVDGIFFMDDLGTSRGMLINPIFWRNVFKPLYKEYCDIIHNSGKFVFFHSDGNIEEIFGDLIEIGIDAINTQLFVMDIEKLGLKYKGKFTLWGELDRQVQAFGTPRDIFKAVLRIKKAFYTGNGGIIAQCLWGKDNSMVNIKAVYDAWNNEY